MGVRLALGASGGQVLWQVVSRLVRLGVSGVVAGLIAAAIAAPHVVTALGAKPLAFWLPGLLIAAALVAAATLAAWVPARRVLGIDPVRALAD
jgi:ABC-type antimicrobial peptide transport system permease subunit